MKTEGLPLSENVEDRRGEKKPKRGPMSLAEALADWKPRVEAERFTPDDTSQLSKAAGVEDIEGGTWSK